jgi:Domain of unknown function (DUF1707)
MTAGPGHPMPGMAGRGRLRASHADRNHVIGMLKAGYVQGRLTKDEFDERLARTLTARTFADLAAVTADLPAGLTDVPPVPPRTPGSPTAAKVMLSVAGGLLAPAVLAAASLTSNAQLYALFILPTMITFVAWIVAGAVVLDAWHDKHSRRPPPPGPRRPGPPGGGRPGGGGRDLQFVSRPPARRPPGWHASGSAAG